MIICINCKITLNKKPVKSKFGSCCSKKCKDAYDFFSDCTYVFIWSEHQQELKKHGRLLDNKQWRKAGRDNYQHNGVLNERGKGLLKNISSELKRVESLLNKFKNIEDLGGNYR